LHDHRLAKIFATRREGARDRVSGGVSVEKETTTVTGLSGYFFYATDAETTSIQSKLNAREKVSRHFQCHNATAIFYSL
jgi:hypothetical protein